MMLYQQQFDYHFHHWAWYMGHTSMCQFHTVLSRFLTAAGYCRKWWCINKLIIIFIIELGIWVILACPNFIRCCHAFWQLLVTVENDEHVWWVTMIVREGLLICVYEWVTLVYWVIRACPNFIRCCHVFWQLVVTVENDDVSTNWL